ncbi:hypothetical protein [Lentzea guizhouensis]|uniref:hypothetical protein n=1 Tax=Lentzea guizhouensis TaxID=1586287 RepID=UPI0012B68E0F|nr:hypothetical protein [Lentzea guizhouensis]
MQNTRRELGWLWGPVVLALLALFTVSDTELVSTRAAHFELSKYAFATLGMPLVAAVVGVWFSRRWPWLLVAGTLGVLVATTESHVHLTSSRPGIASIVASLGSAGAVLIVLGALAAARDAALAAVVVAVPLLGTLFLGLSWLSSPLRPAALEITLAGSRWPARCWRWSRRGRARCRPSRSPGGPGWWVFSRHCCRWWWRWPVTWSRSHRWWRGCCCWSAPVGSRSRWDVARCSERRRWGSCCSRWPRR